MSRRIRSPWALLVGVLALVPGQARAQSTILVDVGRGPVPVHIPSSYVPGAPLPLVMMLHGYGSSGPQTEAYVKLAPLSEQYDFLYTYPTGTQDAAGNRFWNATNACCNFFGSGVDDSAYLLALITEIQSQLSVDARRVYSVGHSNGGFMSYRMACDHPDTFAAIASLAGATFANPGSCAPSSPVHVLQIHGTLDNTIFYGGGFLAGTPYPGAVASVEQWAGFGGCSLVSTTGPNLDLVTNLPGAETTVRRYTMGCQPGGSGELWTIVGGGHVPALSSQFGVRVVEYLLAHPKPDPGQVYCTAKVNSCGGTPQIAASGLPSATGTSGFVVSTSDAKAGKQGLLLYTNQGKRNPPAPFGQGGLLCLAAVNRGPIVSSGGTPGACDGTFSLDLNAFASGNAGGNPQAFLSMPGTQIDCQWWGRDTVAQGAFVSDALEYLVGP